MIALTETETQPRSLKLRHETSNTDSILLSYENVCISFLENLLNDAPLFMNQGPNPSQIEDIILVFLDQLFRDTHEFGPNHSESRR
jgi:hypothetical protein